MNLYQLHMPLKSLEKHTIMTNYMRVMHHFDSLTILNLQNDSLKIITQYLMQPPYKQPPYKQPTYKQPTYKIYLLRLIIRTIIKLDLNKI